MRPSPRGIGSLAIGIAALLLSALPAFAQAMPLAERVKQCAACHGEDGNSTLDKIPSLAGQPAFFVLNQLFLMREGVRQVEPMAAIVKDLKDEDLEALSQHYSKLPARASAEPIDLELAKRGAEIATKMRCGSCHLPTLAGQEQMPRLAKQRVDYLIQAMQDLRDSKRPGADGNMTAAIAGLHEADLIALAHYAASK